MGTDGGNFEPARASGDAGAAGAGGDRGLGALERAGFRWRCDELNWYDIDNRPFLRSYFQVAGMKERQGQSAEALLIYRRIKRTTRPNDPLGARYAVARLPGRTPRRSARGGTT